MKSLQGLFLVTAFAIFVGCQPSSDTANSDTHSHDDGTHTHADGSVHADHDFSNHSHDNPPHGGVYGDWGGGKYHIEFTVNQEKQQATVYILGDDAVTASPIAAESINLALSDPRTQIPLKADPQEGDPEGQCSRFVGTHKNLGNDQKFEGKVYGNVDGKAYSGNFKE